MEEYLFQVMPNPQKIFVIRHQPRVGDPSGDGYLRLAGFIRAELGDEGVEFYASMEDVAYTTALRLAFDERSLKDRYIPPRDDQLEGIRPYGKSHIRNIRPFPLFELTPEVLPCCQQIGHCPYRLFYDPETAEDHIGLDTQGMELEEAIKQYQKELGYERLPEIVARTTNNVLLLTNMGIVERVQTAWGFPRRLGEPPYLSGSLIIPAEGICRELGPNLECIETKQLEKKTE